MIKYLTMILTFIISVPVFGTLTLNHSNQFIRFNHFNPGSDIHKPLILISSQWTGFDIGIGTSLQSLAGVAELTKPEFTDDPLFYPNPFNLREGATLGYGLSRSDMYLDFRVYDMFGYEILRKQFSPNETGGLRGYNRITIDQLFFNHKSLPTGVYFFVFLHNDDLLEKGKFAVIP